jgi:hypothetical protein
MNSGFDQLLFDFDAKAIKVFFSLFDRFKDSTTRLDRKKDENVFQQQLGKFQFTLKEQLEMVAKELIEKNKTITNITHCNKVLSERIAYYLNEFRLKSASA